MVTSGNSAMFFAGGVEKQNSRTALIVIEKTSVFLSTALRKVCKIEARQWLHIWILSSRTKFCMK